jgi:hypothetical protein
MIKSQDPYDYPNDPRERNKLLAGVVIAFLIEVIVCLGIIHLIQKYGDVIDNILK